MNTIKFNDVTFEVESYNKSTYFGGGSINSNASCNIHVDDINVLNTLAQTSITNIQIYSNETIIYNLQNINARIDNISEYLNGDRMNVSVNLIFDNVE